MAAVKDVLEIVGPGGEIRFVELDSARGLLNIGSHPDNDVVLDGPGVAAFHAMLDFQQPAARLTALSADAQIRVGGHSLAAGGSQEIDGYASIEIGGYVLMLLGSSAPAAAPAPDSPSPVAATPVSESPAIPEWDPGYVPEFGRFDRLPPDVLDDFLIVSMEDREDTIDVEQSAIFDLDLVNGGDLVANFNIHVEGVDPRWVTVEPPQVNLLEGQRVHVVVTVTPPRVPTSFAGRHHIAIAVTSPTYPGRRSQVGATVTINPYYEFSVGELSPREQTVSWRNSEGVAEIPIVNRGNGPATFRVEGQDDRQELTFEFDSAVITDEASRTTQDEFALAPDELKLERIHITPLSRRLIGFGKRRHSFTVNITPLESTLTPRSVLGELRAKPLLGPLIIILFGIFMCGGTFWALTPNVREFNVTVAAVDDANPEGKPPDDQTGEDVNAGRAPFVLLRPYRQDGGEKGGNKEEGQQARQLEIGAGQTLIVSWDVWAPFGTINIEPGIGTVDRAAGSVQVTAEESAKYTITVNSPLRRLHQSLGTAAADVAVKVNPVFPRVVLDVEREQLFRGEPTTVWWEIEEADEVTLLTNGAPETLTEHIGSRVITPDADVTFTIVARNRYTGADGVTATKTVTVSEPPPEPVPDPVIERFDISSLNILADEVITLEWKVTGANSIFIDPIGELPPVGTLQQQPTATTTYVLRASDTVTQLRQVTVSPAPTPTPDPRTPTIEFFTATPSTVIIGSTTTLAWSVKNDGDTITNVEIKSVNFQRGGLDPVSSLAVTITDRTLFVLTAYNGNLRASATVEVVANNPVPDLSSISPDSSTDIGSGGIGITLTGSNFIESSVVRWNGADRPTTYASGTQLNAAVSASDLITPGTASVTVHNPGPGGGDSGAKTFTLKYPAPTLSSINPTSVVKGTSVANITLTGSGFASGSKALWNGTDLGTTSFVNATQLTLTVPSAQLAAAGSISITVSNPTPGGGASSAQTFTITDTNPVPTIAALDADAGTAGDQNSVPAGSGDTSVKITGTNFVSGAIARWNGSDLATTFTSATEISATVPAAKLATSGSFTITVINPTPGGGVSSGAAFTVTNPTGTFEVYPATTACPAGSGSTTVTAGGVDQTLEITATGGTVFQAGSTVRWDTGAVTIITPTSVTSSSICAPVSNTLIANAGSASVTVLTGPTTTSPQLITIASPTVSFSPTTPTATVGANTAVTVSLNAAQQIARTLTLTSSNPAVMTVSTGTISTSTVNNTTTPSFNITGVAVGTADLQVKLPASLGGGTTSVSVAVTNPQPTLSSLGTTSRDAGTASFTLIANGSSFINGAKIYWDATPLVTSFVNSTQLSATVSSALLASPTSVNVKVQNPATCTPSCDSSNKSFTVTAPTVSITPTNPSVEVGSTVTLTATISNAQINNTIITLSSGDTSKATVPASIILAPGTLSGTFDVTGVAGNASDPQPSVTITATLPGGIGGNSGNRAVSVTKVTPLVELNSDEADNTTQYGETFVLTVTVNGVVVPLGTPDGAINFKAGGASIGSCSAKTLSSGAITCTISVANANLLAAAAHTLQATYTPNGATNAAGKVSNLTWTTADSGQITHTVQKADTATGTPSLTVGTNPSTYGDTVTLTVSVTSTSSGTPTVVGGTVRFEAANVDITGCTAQTVTSGSASCTITTAVNAGTYTNSIKAQYIGGASPDNYNSSSESPGLSHTINKASTTLKVTSNPNVSAAALPSTATLSATVTSGAGAVADGMVTYAVAGIICDVGSVLGVTVAGGAVPNGSCIVPAGTAQNTYTISATYTGGTNFANSSSTTDGTLTVGP